MFHGIKLSSSRAERSSICASRKCALWVNHVRPLEGSWSDSDRFFPSLAHRGRGLSLPPYSLGIPELAPQDSVRRQR